VNFVEEKGEMGAQASTVRIVAKQGERRAIRAASSAG